MYVMKTVKSIFLLLIFLILSGCATRSHVITSDYTPIQRYAHDIPPIFLPLALRVSPYPEGFSMHFEINDHVNSKYYFSKIDLDVDLETARTGLSNYLIGSFSFLIPPLSLISFRVQFPAACCERV
jgi:hypothetical protein